MARECQNFPGAVRASFGDGGRRLYLRRWQRLPDHLNRFFAVLACRPGQDFALGCVLLDRAAGELVKQHLAVLRRQPHGVLLEQLLALTTKYLRRR